MRTHAATAKRARSWTGGLAKLDDALRRLLAVIGDNIHARGKSHGYVQNSLHCVKASRRPRDIIDHLSAAIMQPMSDRPFVDARIKVGVDPITDSNPDKAAAMIRAELAKWSP